MHDLFGKSNQATCPLPNGSAARFAKRLDRISEKDDSKAARQKQHLTALSLQVHNAKKELAEDKQERSVSIRRAFQHGCRPTSPSPAVAHHCLVGRFDDAKRYYDVKHKCYALKKAVVVSSMYPHYAVMFGKAVPGAKHDYADLKDNYAMLVPYLAKTKQETQEDKKRGRGDAKRSKVSSLSLSSSSSSLSSSSPSSSWKCSFDKAMSEMRPTHQD
jgi:hypothetical protein